jgi:membrane associated rhomboid family serine protease
MLYDRPYMRESREERSTSVLVWLIAAIVAGYLLQNIFLKVLHVGPAAEALFGLSIAGIRGWHLWTLVTYSFLHSPDNWLHIICNVMALYFLGRELLPVLGPKRFLGIYFAGVVAGGLLWSVVNWRAGGMVIGASAGVMTLLIVFACLYPDKEVTLLLFFVLPVTLKPKYLALGCAVIDLFGCFFYEILGNVSPLGFAHSAHLGGMAAGWLYFRFGYARPDWLEIPGRATRIELPHWMRRPAPAAVAKPAFRVNIGNRDTLRAEVDRILDKINSKGFGALTPEEKKLLDEARDLLSRR